MMQQDQAKADTGRRVPEPPIYGPEGFAGMRRAGRLTAEALDVLMEATVPGVTTEALDRLAYTFAMDHRAYPASLLYRGYPKSICTSINHVVCHGIPGDKVLKDGDIVNIDHTVIVDGWHGDSSRMYGVGTVNARARKLIDVTYDSLDAGLAMIKPGNTFGDIGYAIQQVVEANRMSVVRDFCGHGIGRLFHDSPNVLHYGRRGEGAILKTGMFFTVEPMVNLGKPHVKVLSDGWTAVTRDKSLSSQCEHTIGVTEDGLEIFSASPAGLFRPKFQS